MFVGYVCVCVFCCLLYRSSFICVCVCEFVTQCATHWINNAPRPVSILLCYNYIAFYPDT
jgi:hypothetical protein